VLKSFEWPGRKTRLFCFEVLSRARRRNRLQDEEISDLRFRRIAPRTVRATVLADSVRSPPKWLDG
jgi:hypothetical protein